MSFLENMRKRGAAALGVAAVASGVTYTASEHDDIMARSASFVSELHDAGTSLLRGEHAETYTVETPSGPVTFQLNQADEGSIKFATRLESQGDLPAAKEVNSFSRDDRAVFETALEQVSSTKAGMEVLSKVAETSDGTVQVLAVPGMTGTAVAKNRFYEDEDGGFKMHDPSDTSIRIGYDPKAVDKDGISTLAYIGADGKMHRATMDRILIHELQHAAVRDDSATHHVHDHGKTFTYDVDGKVTDLAMDAGNRHRREILGGNLDALHAADRVYYDKVELSLGENSFEGMSELNRVVARDEVASWGMFPGYSSDRKFPPTAATLGVLNLDDDRYLTHVREFAKDVAVEASMRGGGVPGRDWVEAVSKESDPQKVISMVAPFVDRAEGAAQSSGKRQSPELADMKHHVEVAGLVASYRNSSKHIVSDAEKLPVAGLSEAVRKDPQEALSLYSSSLKGAFHQDVDKTLTNDLFDEKGVHARVSGFMTKFDAVRRERAKELINPLTKGADQFALDDARFALSKPLYKTGDREMALGEVQTAQERRAFIKELQAQNDNPDKAPKRVAISLGKSQDKSQKSADDNGAKGIAAGGREDAASSRMDRIARAKARAQEVDQKRREAHATRPKARGSDHSR